MPNLFDIYKTFEHGLPGVNSQLKYPLENQSDYLGKITFTPVEEKEVNMLEVTPTKDDFFAAVKEGGKLAGNVINDIFDVAEAEGPDAIVDDQESRVKQALDKAGEGAKEGFYGKVEPAPAFSERDLKLNTNKRISLYLPRAIQIQDTVTYDNQFQLGLIGGAIEAGLAGGSGVVGSAVGAIAGEAVGLYNTIFNKGGSGMSKEAAGILSGKIAARIPVAGDAAGGAVRSATRLTTNPNTRAIFKDVPIRNFSFTFQLIPTSQNEAIAVENIIKTFRSELYPVSLRTAGVNVGYKFPNRFLIKVKYNNKDIQGIRFLPVYMQSFNATYNSATGGMHSDGRFSAVDITMAFTETRAIAKQDIEAGY